MPEASDGELVILTVSERFCVRRPFFWVEELEAQFWSTATGAAQSYRKSCTVRKKRAAACLPTTASVRTCVSSLGAASKWRHARHTCDDLMYEGWQRVLESAGHELTTVPACMLSSN